MKDRLKKLRQVPLAILDGDRGVNYPNKSEFQEAGFCLFLNTSNVTKTGFDFSSTDFVSKERDALLRKGKLRRDDVVMTTRGTIGNVAYYGDHISYEHIRINSGMVILRAEAKKLDPYFLYSFLRSDLFKKQTRSQGSGSAQPQLPIGSLRNIVIPQLDFSDQQDIGKVLATLDAKIELNNRINKELEGMAKLLYDYWFVQFDFPITAAQATAMRKPHLKGKPYRASGGKMIYSEALKREIPEVWVPGAADSLFSFNPSVTLKDGTVAGFFDMDAVPTRGFMTKKVQRKAFSGGTKFANGDVVVARITPCLENGKTALITQLEDGQTGFGSTEFIVMRGKPRSLSAFGACIARSEHYRKFAILNMTGTSGRKRIEASVLKTFPLPIPSIELLSNFEEICEPMFQEMTENEKQNQELTELRDWLLPMLMNGQVTVG